MAKGEEWRFPELEPDNREIIGCLMLMLWKVGNVE